MRISWAELKAMKPADRPKLAPLMVCCICFCVVRRLEFMKHACRCAKIELGRKH